VTCGTVAIIIWVVLLSPYLHIRGVSLSSIHYNQSHTVYMNRRQYQSHTVYMNRRQYQSHTVYMNRRQQYICLIWN
jgi:hypothetical protein